MYDIIVVGAGMVGVSVALEAQRRGLKVALVDRKEPGEETSYGNAGVVDGGNLLPVAMPRDIPTLFQHALNLKIQSHYHFAALPKMAKWMFDYWRWSSPERLEQTARQMRPIFAEAVGAHREFARIAGAEHYFRQTGWIKIYRTPETLAKTKHEIELSKEWGLNNVLLTRDETLELEPHLKPNFAGSVWAQDTDTVSSPGGVTKAYARAFVAAGGTFLKGDADTLRKNEGGFSVMTESGAIESHQAVVALGPWSVDLIERFGYRMPLAPKRGYHVHYRPVGNKLLTRQICDEDVGYVLAPMELGTRLTTGVEIAERDAVATPVQVARAKAKAADLFDLGEAVEDVPWMGRRPATPDTKPVIDEASRHKGLWFAFGHGHWGFTLGPATAKALVSAMQGETPFVDLSPYKHTRWD